MFFEKVDKRSRKKMCEFLDNHFRYSTMNPWNGCTSFANNVKIYNLKLGELESKAYEAIQDELMYEICVYPIINEFSERTNGRYTIGFNGRCGGYLVLYSSEYELSQYKSYCPKCGQQNFKEVPEGEVGVCGRCRQQSRVNYKEIPKVLRIFPGRSIELDEDTDMRSLKELVEIVEEFDKTCDEIIESFTSYLRDMYV